MGSYNGSAGYRFLRLFRCLTDVGLLIARIGIVILNTPFGLNLAHAYEIANTRSLEENNNSIRTNTPAKRFMNVDRSACGPHIDALEQAVDQSIGNLENCFQVQYPQNDLLDAIENIQQGGTITCSPNPPERGVKLMENVDKKLVTVFPRFFADVQDGFQDAVEGVTHEVLHLARIDNLPREEHNQGSSIRFRDRVYSCARLCSKPKNEWITQDECSVCVTFGPSQGASAIQLCHDIAPRSVFDSLYAVEGSYDSSCKYPPRSMEQYSCRIASADQVRNKIREILNAYPRDNRNKVNLLAVDRNFRQQQLEWRAKLFCRKFLGSGDRSLNNEFTSITADREAINLEIENRHAEEGMGRIKMDIPADNSPLTFCSNLKPD